MNQYRHVRGIRDGGNEDNENEHEKWVGKVLAIEDSQVQMQWLWRLKDLPKESRAEWEHRHKRELLMTSSESQRTWVGKQHVLECLTVSEGSEDASTDYHWTRLYFPDLEMITGPCIQVQSSCCLEL